MTKTLHWPIHRNESYRFTVLALLLFANIFVAQSSDVVATSGFIANVSTPGILWVWALDNVLMGVAAALYGLFADRIRRERLAITLLLISSVIYIGLFWLFQVNAPDWLRYSVLLLIGDQQYLLFPIVIWTMANDMFSMSEAKRLFPLLGAATVLGSLLGNLIPGLVQFTGIGNTQLLGFNAGFMLISGVFLFLAIPKLNLNSRQSKQGQDFREVFKEGLTFIKEIPVFFYLTIAMLLCGVAFNTSEFHLISSAATSYGSATDLQGFYGLFRSARTVILVILQAGITTILINKLGFKHIFGLMPLILLVGLAISLGAPGLLGAIIGNGLARLVLEGIDEPARRSFLGLVPDERRGRVSAFVEGYLYSGGSLISCALIGYLVVVGAPSWSYLLLAMLATGVALWAVWHFRITYDKSMLNWRLNRRKRSSMLDSLGDKLK
jgi:ATP:ADP antiporter, AAA family